MVKVFAAHLASTYQCLLRRTVTSHFEGQKPTYCKSSSLWGAYLISDAPDGDLIERGLIIEEGLCTESNEMDMNKSFSVLLLHILRIQHTIS